MSLDEMKRRHTLSVVERFGGNHSEAAMHLGISRNTVAAMLRREHGLAN